MAALTPEQATLSLQTIWIPAYGWEHPVTKSVISAIPHDKADYRPDPVVKSALDLAWHIVAAELMFLNAVADGTFTYGTTRPESIRTPADVLTWYSEQFAAAVERLKSMAGEQLTKPVDFRGMFTRPAVTFLHTGLNHTIHHRGQLSMYLRPMGAKVPSIYGESFDAREARERAQKASDAADRGVISS
jgi:uncharacterized damage-inducible protein DinB